MLIKTRCVHCRAVFEVADSRLGQAIVCARCDREFVMTALAEDERVFALAEEEADVQEAVVLETRATWKGDKQDLRIAPPPTEFWNASGEEDDPTGQPFSRFQPTRKELAPFLEPEAERDLGAMLGVAGLIVAGVLVLAVLLVLIVLCIVH